MCGFPRISKGHARCLIIPLISPLRRGLRAMEMLDVDEAVCAIYFTMMLDGTARTWLKSLPANSINSWDELKAKLIANFKDTCKQPMSIVDLAACV